jgi:hypothetical protein
MGWVGSGSEVRDPENLISDQDPGVKKHRIPDPQHWNFYLILKGWSRNALHTVVHTVPGTSYCPAKCNRDQKVSTVRHSCLNVFAAYLCSRCELQVYCNNRLAAITL